MINKKLAYILFLALVAIVVAGCGVQTEETADTGVVVAAQPVLGEEGAAVEETVVVETGSADVNVDAGDVEVTVGESGVDVSVGNEENDAETAEETEEAEIVTVAMRDYKFDEQEITIKEGTTVIWTNYDSAPHTVDGEGLDSGTISKGESWTYTFTTKGLYDYYCSYHPSMTGTVVVE